MPHCRSLCKSRLFFFWMANVLPLLVQRAVAWGTSRVASPSKPALSCSLGFSTAQPGFRGSKPGPCRSLALAHRNRSGVSNPVLHFLAFFGKRQGKPQKKQGFFIPTEPPNPWKRREKRSKKQGIPRRGKKQGIPKKQGKEGQGKGGFPVAIINFASND